MKAATSAEQKGRRVICPMILRSSVGEGVSRIMLFTT